MFQIPHILSSSPPTMAQPYPTPPYPHTSPLPVHPAHPLLVAAYNLLDQPPPPTLREILNAYKSKGDGDRDMLLAMLNAKSAEDQRMASVANLHHKLLESTFPSTRIPFSPEAYAHLHYQHPPQPLPPNYPYTHSPHPSSSSSSSSSSVQPQVSAASPSTLPRLSPHTSPQNVTLPSIHSVQNPRKRPRSSRSPPPADRRSTDSTVSKSASATEQLPPSPPFSSPGRSTAAPELSATGTHTASRDAMAIGSLLSSGGKQQEGESEWSAKTSSERDREGHR